MLNSVYKEDDNSETDESTEWTVVGEEAESGSTPEQTSSFAWQVANTVGSNVAYCAKWGTIYVSGTVIGCFTSVAIAPRLAPVIISYVAPSAAESSLVTATTAASVVSMGYGISRHVGAKVVEGAWDLSSSAIIVASSKAINFLYGGKKELAKQQTTQDDEKRSELAKPLIPT